MRINVIAFLSTLLALTMTGCARKVPTTTKSNDERIYSILSSKSWNWEHRGCSENRQRFSFQDNKMTIKYDNPVKRQHSHEYVRETLYIILGSIENGIRTEIGDEYRKDSNGQVVEWDLILENDSTFYWRRSDWPSTPISKPLIACE